MALSRGGSDGFYTKHREDDLRARCDGYRHVPEWTGERAAQGVIFSLGGAQENARNNHRLEARMNEQHMTPEEFTRIHDASGLTGKQLCEYLRISDRRSISRYRHGDMGVSGPVSILMEQLAAQSDGGKGE